MSPQVRMAAQFATSSTDWQQNSMVEATANTFGAPAWAGVQAVGNVGSAIAVAVTVACSKHLGDS